MTEKVVDLDSYRPHTQGAALCLHCKYEWQAVAPIGTTEFDCPKCGLIKGAYKALCMPEGPYWLCNCGCYHFVITDKYAYCAKCGMAQEF